MENKMIVVCLTQNDMAWILSNGIDYKYETVAYTWKSFCKAINKKMTHIYTTVLDAVDSNFYNSGYDIKVISQGKSILFSKLLNEPKEGDRELRLGHNWHKMLLNGEWNNYIKTDFFKKEWWK